MYKKYFKYLYSPNINLVACMYGFCIPKLISSLGYIYYILYKLNLLLFENDYNLPFFINICLFLFFVQL